MVSYTYDVTKENAREGGKKGWVIEKIPTISTGKLSPSALLCRYYRASWWLLSLSFSGYDKPPRYRGEILCTDYYTS